MVKLKLDEVRKAFVRDCACEVSASTHTGWPDWLCGQQSASGKTWYRRRYSRRDTGWTWRPETLLWVCAICILTPTSNWLGWSALPVSLPAEWGVSQHLEHVSLPSTPQPGMRRGRRKRAKTRLYSRYHLALQNRHDEYHESASLSPHLCLPFTCKQWSAGDAFLEWM